MGRPDKETAAKSKAHKQQYGERIPFERKKIILGMLERGGRIIFKKIGQSLKELNKDNVYPHLEKHIDKDATFVTDESRLYHAASQIFTNHQTVNHKKGYVIDGITTNSIEGAWNHLKRMIIGTYFHLSFKHLRRYLNMQAYRWNGRKQNQKALFEDFIPNLFGKRLDYKTLTCEEQTKIAA